MFTHAATYVIVAALGLSAGLTVAAHAASPALGASPVITPPRQPPRSRGPCCRRRRVRACVAP